MKLLHKLLIVTFLLFSITNIRVHAQISKITHVIVVIQENRTPDNLFAADPALVHNGGDIVDLSKSNQVPCKGKGTVTLDATVLDACFDPNHGHSAAWIPTYDGGLRLHRPGGRLSMRAAS